MFFELTQRCNLECRHCGTACTPKGSTAFSRGSLPGEAVGRGEGSAPGVPRPPRGSSPELSAEDVLGVLQDVARTHVPRNIQVVLTGGEPLVWPGVFDLGARIDALGFRWAMVTNGQAWRDEHFAAARAANLDNVAVSLDGLEEDHDWLRQRPGAFRRTIETIRRLVAERAAARMDVVTCVHPGNLEHLPEVRRLLTELGVRRWRLFTIDPIGRAAELPELQLSVEQHHRLMRSILVWKGMGGLKVSLSAANYLGPRLEHRVRPFDYLCLAGVHIGGVMCDGSVLACPNIDRRLSQGNIHQERFTEVWEQRFQRFRHRDWMKVGPCTDCGEWRLCQGNDLHLWDEDAGRQRLCHFRDLELDSFDPKGPRIQS